MLHCKTRVVVLLLLLTLSVHAFVLLFAHGWIVQNQTDPAVLVVLLSLRLPLAELLNPTVPQLLLALKTRRRSKR